MATWEELRDRQGVRLDSTNLLDHFRRMGEEERRRLTVNPPSSWREQYFLNATFDDARVQEHLQNELYLGKTVPPSNAVSCTKCGRTNVSIEKTQKSRADEGGGALGTCQSCGNRFPIN